jgi:hypothetical protein
MPTFALTPTPPASTPIPPASPPTPSPTHTTPPSSCCVAICVGDYVQALAGSSEDACGTAMPVEIALIILFRHAGLRTPTAQAFATGYEQLKVAYRRRPQKWLPTQNWCLCGAKDNQGDYAPRYRSSLLDCRATYVKPGKTITKQTAAHLWPRRGAVYLWLTQGGWEKDHRTMRDRCGVTTLLRRSMGKNVPEHMTLLPRSPTTEVDYLRFGNVAMIRKAIIMHRGGVEEGVLPSERLLRGQWVREYYNRLRGEDRLEDWPRANAG